MWKSSFQHSERFLTKASAVWKSSKFQTTFWGKWWVNLAYPYTNRARKTKLPFTPNNLSLEYIFLLGVARFTLDVWCHLFNLYLNWKAAWNLYAIFLFAIVSLWSRCDLRFSNGKDEKSLPPKYEEVPLKETTVQVQWSFLMDPFCMWGS